MSSILLLSSQDRVAEKIKNALLPHAITTEVVKDSSLFLARLAEVEPFLVVIDIDIEAKTGIKHLEALRNAGGVYSHIPVIIAEETGDLLVISEALRFNVADYFVTTKLDEHTIVQKIFKNLPKDSGIVIPPDVLIQEKRKYILLLVEDDRFLRDLTVQKFSLDKSINIITAVDGEQGVTLAEKHIPHIILLDVALPGIDGFEVLKRLRAKPQFARTIIVMLSNFGQREDMDKAIALGANQFLVKANYTLDEILTEVRRLLGI